MADYRQFAKNQGRFRGVGCFNPAALVRSVNDWREKRHAAISGRANRKGRNDWRRSTFRSRQTVEKDGTWCFLTVKPVTLNSAKHVLQSMKEVLGDVPFIPLFIKIGSNGVMSFYLKNKAAADVLAASSTKCFSAFNLEEDFEASIRATRWSTVRIDEKCPHEAL
ncbi:hypothetical protein D918_08623 [Trichuris suis]|nr:hypothetical protein D918_08623 [Trichuris suis]